MKTLAEARVAVGFGSSDTATNEHDVLEYLNLRLAALGAPIYGQAADYPLLQLGDSLLANIRAQRRFLTSVLCPADQAIHDFLESYLADIKDELNKPPAEVEGVNDVASATAPTGATAIPFAPKHESWLPAHTLILDRHGLARTLSLPPDADEFRSEILNSYRVFQGVCHNPAKDRRTTDGVFHVTAGGFPVPADKKEVPKLVFARLLQRALHPPRELLRLPFTASQDAQAEVFLSLLLRPMVSPDVPGFSPYKAIEVRFFAPGSLVANLDFVESIFGNAGDPYLPRNDARLDIEHWSGHTGCVILAPHLINATKRELGLPHVSQATPRQVRDGMCWRDPGERYNDGGAFKITCRDHRGIIVTLIADNYFGYCKKEVKTQLSYAANLLGMCEEEHAGGTIAFPSFDLGEDFEQSTYQDVRHIGSTK